MPKYTKLDPVVGSLSLPLVNPQNSLRLATSFLRKIWRGKPMQKQPFQSEIIRALLQSSPTKP